MKKTIATVLAFSTLLIAQTNSPFDEMEKAMANPNSKPILLHIHMYDLETNGSVNIDALSNVNDQPEFESKLDQLGQYHLARSYSTQTRSEVPSRIFNTKEIPYMGDCNLSNDKQLECKPIFAKEGVDINLVVRIDKNGFCMLDSDLTYLDISGYSHFEFNGNKFEIPQIKEHRQKRSSLLNYGQPSVLIDKKDETHYRFAVISIDQPKDKK